MPIDRKNSPKQDRSRATVDAIVEAAARILQREGHDALNTNRLAEVAGVSVGSLYRFFGNKELVLEEALTRVLDAQTLRSEELLSSGALDGLAPELALRRLIESLVDDLDRRGAMAAALVKLVPRIVGAPRMRAVDERMIPLLLSWISRNRHVVDRPDPALAITICLQTVRATLFTLYVDATRRRPREALVEEVVTLIVRYLGLKATP